MKHLTELRTLIAWPTRHSARTGYVLGTLGQGLVVMLVLIPLVASIASIIPGWRPSGDVAALVLRSQDIFTRGTPLVGMPSSAGGFAGAEIHHPGPLEFWLVGIVTGLSGSPRTILLIPAAANGLSILAIMHWCRRLGGTGLMIVGCCVIGMATWSLRGDVLGSPFNPFVTVLPLMACMVGALAWAAGIRWAGPIATFMGSWAAQGHLTMVGPVLGVTICCLLTAAWRRLNGTAAERSVGRVEGHAAVGVALLCWSGPILDVILRRGGNVRALLATRNEVGGASIGWDGAARAALDAVAPRPVWAGAGFDARTLTDPVGTFETVSGMAILVLCMGLALILRRHRPMIAFALSVSFASLILGTAAAARMPTEFFAIQTFHNYLWLWAVSALLWASLIVGIAAWIGLLFRGRAIGKLRTLGLAGLLVVGAGAAAGSVRGSHRMNGIAHVYVEGLRTEVSATLVPGQIYELELSQDIATYGVAVGLWASLRRTDVTLTVDKRHSQTFGARRITEGVASEKLVIVMGRTPPDPPDPRARLIAQFEPDLALLARRRTAERAVVARIRSEGHINTLIDPDPIPAVAARAFVEQRLVPLARFRALEEPWLQDPNVRELVNLAGEPTDYVRAYLVETAG